MRIRSRRVRRKVYDRWLRALDQLKFQIQTACALIPEAVREIIVRRLPSCLEQDDGNLHIYFRAKCGVIFL